MISSSVDKFAPGIFSMSRKMKVTAVLWFDESDASSVENR